MRGVMHSVIKESGRKQNVEIAAYCQQDSTLKQVKEID